MSRSVWPNLFLTVMTGTIQSFSKTLSTYNKPDSGNTVVKNTDKVPVLQTDIK